MGKVIGEPKASDKSVSSKTPVTLRQLAEAEQSILNAIDELAEKLLTKKKTTKPKKSLTKKS